MAVKEHGWVWSVQALQVAGTTDSQNSADLADNFGSEQSQGFNIMRDYFRNTSSSYLNVNLWMAAFQDPGKENSEIKFEGNKL